jgi:CheY-like chemotaxis protein
MIQYMESTDDVRLVGVTNHIVKALEYVTDSLPDAIILDLELQKGYGNGLAFLDSLKEIKLSVPIYILVTTNNISAFTHEGARKMGADFIMVKSQVDYSAKSVIDLLRSLKNVIHSHRRAASHSDDTESRWQKQHRIMSRIMTELDRVGIPPNAVGRKYLMDGIVLIVDGRNEKICAAISRQYGKTEASVERAMQNAIEKAWRTAHIEDLEKYYTARIRSAKGTPTMMEFIYYYAEKIRNEY